jgi:transposase
MAVMIGVDPHKRSHTAVAIDDREEEMARIEVRATKRQVQQLRKWATLFDERVWAIESASGLGYLLAQQLVAAGEDVVDVPATLAARVRVLGTGRSNKNDPNDGRSVAVAALRAPSLPSVQQADHSAVLRLLAKRNLDLGRERNRIACRLHAMVCELVAGGITKEIKACVAEEVLRSVTATTVIESAKVTMALELVDDIRRVDTQIVDIQRRIRDAVVASKTSLTDLYGVGPVIAALVIGYTGDVTRFATRDCFAAYNGTAPIEMSSGGRVVHRLSRRGNRILNYAIHMAAMAQIRQPASEGRAYFDRKVAEGKTTREAIRALKRRISDRIYRQLLVDADRQRA